MATEYHLLTCLGQGVTATLTVASPCVVTYAASGMRNGHAVVWEDNSDTLPTGLVHGTTYYVRPIDANTFHLYDTEAHAKDIGSTTGRIDTSGSQSGTHKLVGDYWYRLPAADPGGGGNYRARYANGVGGYWCWDTIYNLRVRLYDNKSYVVEVFVEIQGAWTDSSAHYLSGRSGYQWDGYFSINISTMVNGARDPLSFHYGVPGSGWRWLSTANYHLGFTLAGPRCVIDGVETGSTYANTSTRAFKTYASACTIKNCIAIGYGYGTGFEEGGKGNSYYNNIATGFPVGFQCAGASGNGSVFANCLSVGNGTGFACLVASTSAIDSANNISIANTTNWGTAGIGFADCNAGATGDSIWATSGSSSVDGLTTAVFVDYAADDFRPATGAATIDAGSSFFGLLPPTDIVGSVAPSYTPAAHPYDIRDIGPFEYDHGYGLAPATVAIDITGMVDGSVLAIYRTSDHAEIVAPTTIGASGSYSTTYSWTGNVSITVVVRKATGGTKYLPYSAPGLITIGGFGLVVSQVEDLVLNG